MLFRFSRAKRGAVQSRLSECHSDDVRGARLRSAGPGFAVIVAAVLFSVLVLRSTSRWWYEDDAAQYATASAIRNPVRIFLDPGVVRRFGTGASLVPMQLLSYWIDTHFFGVSPRAAYVHSLLSTVATVFLLYLLLLRLTGNPAASACVAALWLLLPSTIAVHSFLSTRHYMEGLGWSLAACLLFDRCASVRRDRCRLLLAAAFLCAAAALLSKEIYVIALPAWLFLAAMNRRRFSLAAGVVVLSLAYGAYRLLVLGIRANYPASFPTVGEYMRYLGVLPYTFSANRGGYALLALLVAGSAAVFIRRRPGAARHLLFLAVLLGLVLLPSLPTALPLLATHESPGTWYRSVFLINTVLLAGGASFAIRHGGRVAAWAALVLLLAFLVPGAERTRRFWDARFRRSEAEGTFYLANPGKLVYSEEDAAWFLYGIDRLYGVQRSHYVNKLEVDGPKACRMIGEFDTIWRFRDGRWREDRELYSEIARRTAPARVKE
jgi:hypothetical protein